MGSEGAWELRRGGGEQTVTERKKKSKKSKKGEKVKKEKKTTHAGVEGTCWAPRVCGSCGEVVVVVANGP